ncbi:unnamed protein product [Rhodiola kirilowii]
MWASLYGGAPPDLNLKMAVSFNSVVSFNSTTKNHCTRKTHFLTLAESQRMNGRRHHHLCLSVANGDKFTKEKASVTDENPSLTDPTPAISISDLGSQSSEVPNGNALSQETQVKKTPLTVKEKLRAARVLSRYGTPKPKANRAKLGSSVLDALKESDKGKRSGLPEAPTNLLDDSKRGMPKAGLTFDLPGGRDLLVIAFSFVFISTVMFATTYLVWKLGAIHFNEN